MPVWAPITDEPVYIRYGTEVIRRNRYIPKNKKSKNSQWRLSEVLKTKNMMEIALEGRLL